MRPAHGFPCAPGYLPRLLPGCFVRHSRRAVLGSPVRLYGDDRDSMQSPVVLHPPEKVPPTGVGYRFGKMPVPNHIAYLEVFIGKETR